jgi:hypothetical protein
MRSIAAIPDRLIRRLCRRAKTHPATQIAPKAAKNGHVATTMLGIEFVTARVKWSYIRSEPDSNDAAG